MQEEIKEIFNYFIKYANIEDSIKISKLEDYITNLQEENEKLNMVVTIQEDYKSRNEKAIEYIKENSKNISITPNSVKAVPVEYILELLEEIK